MSDARQRSFTIIISVLYVTVALIYTVATPPFEASDELWHYPMVQFVATNGLQLPVQDPSVSTAWRQEGSQPPLYYLAAGLLTSWIDTSDLDRVRRVNPHADIGVVRADGNANMIVHRINEEAFPWTGAVLALYLSRFFSIVLGLCTIWVTFSLARTLFPERGEVAVGAAVLNATLPMFLFISSSVNNDNLSNLLGNLLTLLVVRLLAAKHSPSRQDFVMIGLAAGAGMLAKFNIGFMLPIIALVYLILSLRHRSPRPLVEGGLISGGLTLLIAGWWYVRNLSLYGDPTGLNVFLDVVGRRAIPANAAQLWAERHSFTQFFWGGFGGVNIPMPDAVYLIFNVIGLIGLTGMAAFVLARLWKRDWQREHMVAFGIPVLWVGITFISYLRWTSETPASQGRLMFGALSTILIWIVLGWTWWLPRRGRLLPAVLLGVWFAGIAVYAPFGVIGPVYARPERIPGFEAQQIFRDSEGRSVGLSPEATIASDSVRPGDSVLFTTRWQIERALNRDWSLFAHLVTADGVIIAQRDIYPGGGLLATTDLVTGFAWENRIAIPVPRTAVANQTLTIVIGWYDHLTGERMMLADGSETAVVGTVELLPWPSPYGDIPNAISVNFGDQMELAGYTVSDLSLVPGQELDVTLYWRGLQPIDLDYVIFVHVIDPATTAIYGASDAQPANWTRPTSSWQPGAIVEDTHTFTISPEAPSQSYELEIGVYLQLDNQFPRLRVLTPDGGMANDFVYLTRVRVVTGANP